MPSNEPDVTQEQRAVHNPLVTFDRTDLSARAVILFFIMMAIGGVLVLSSMWGAYRYMAGRYMAAHRTTNPMATSNQELAAVGGDPSQNFPAPRLQPDGVADLNKFRWREDEILNSYGWVDQANGKIHIPIQQAIDLIAARGLPVQPETVPAVSAPKANK